MPATAPLIAAITGLGTERIEVNTPRKSSPHVASPACGGGDPGPPAPRSASAPMSAPAQKPRPAPVTTIPTTRGSALAEQGVVELAGHRRRPRIERVGPVQRDRRDRVVDVVQDLGVGHSGKHYRTFTEPVAKAF